VDSVGSEAWTSGHVGSVGSEGGPETHEVGYGHCGFCSGYLSCHVLILKESQKIQNDREYLWVYLGIEYTQLY
jgi:hypothetical protein